MPVVVYSVLRVALLAASWVLLSWAGLHPLVALLVAAFVAWGLSYVALGGPRDAAARYLAQRAAARAEHAGRPVLSPHAREDADAEDAAVDAALASGPADLGPTGPGSPDAEAGEPRTSDPGAVEPRTGDPGASTAQVDRPEGRAGGPQSASASPSSMP